MLGSLTGKTRRWVKSISLLKGVKILSSRRRVMWLALLIYYGVEGLRRETELPQGDYPLKYPGFVPGRGKERVLNR